MIISSICFTLAIAAYSISQKAQHGQLRWSDPKKPFGFWGAHSDKRKYKYSDTGEKEPAFFLSTTLLVFLTDGYHLMQFIFFLFISLSVVPLLNWTYGIAFWILAHVIHFTLYRTLQR